MGSVYVLVTAMPGKERELYEKLAAMPGLKERQHLFGEQIALRLEEQQLAEAAQLAAWTGVREARVYHDHDVQVLKARAS